MSEFSSMLKYLRDRENYTQSELAKKLDISRSTIGMYEAGEREPDFEMLEAIADIFNVDMNFLLGKSDSNLDDSANNIESMLSVLMDSSTIMLDGKPASAEAAEYLRQSFEAVLEHAKKINNQKQK